MSAGPGERPGERANRARIAAAVAGAGVLVVLALLWVNRGRIEAWWRFVAAFESLGTDAAGLAEYRHRRTGIIMVRVPGGTFPMGSPEGEEGSRPDERPRHRVTLSPFLIARHEVSQAVWEAVMGDDRSTIGGADLPVVNVSWHDCREFCGRTGLALPTEAQWERACRGGAETPFGFGETISTAQENHNPQPSDDPAVAAPAAPVGPLHVGTLEPNAFGLHDMHGNVQEWCDDVYGAEFYERPESSALDPLCTQGSGSRVVRGGSWLSRPRNCRAASRSWEDPGVRTRTIGFRPVWPPRE